MAECAYALAPALVQLTTTSIYVARFVEHLYCALLANY